MELVLIAIVTLGAALLTFFSGFGLGTILMPVFALFFPLEIAIALTAVVHLLNNLFKVSLVWKDIDLKVVLLFGLPAMLAAFGGAYVLSNLSASHVSYSYKMGTWALETDIINLVIAGLLSVFAIFELNKKLVKLALPGRFLPLGGILSGFFGGISGHQGALRSLFLLKAGLSKEGFIASGISIAILIDISRLTVYGTSFLFEKLQATDGGQSTTYVLVACLSAFVGSYFGKKLLNKITIRNVQIIVSVMLLVFAILLGMGIV